jgi:hypothetical protein
MKRGFKVEQKLSARKKISRFPAFSDFPNPKYSEPLVHPGSDFQVVIDSDWNSNQAADHGSHDNGVRDDPGFGAVVRGR